jgi:hypothetical protein
VCSQTERLRSNSERKNEALWWLDVFLPSLQYKTEGLSGIHDTLHETHVTGYYTDLTYLKPCSNAGRIIGSHNRCFSLFRRMKFGRQPSTSVSYSNSSLYCNLNLIIPTAKTMSLNALATNQSLIKAVSKFVTTADWNPVIPGGQLMAYRLSAVSRLHSYVRST